MLPCSGATFSDEPASRLWSTWLARIRHASWNSARGSVMSMPEIVRSASRANSPPGWLKDLPARTFYPAVFLAAAVGGFGPGFMATTLAVLLIGLIDPDMHFAVEHSDAIRLVVFAGMGIGISALAGLARRQQACERR